jgi:hypothetical protein
VSSTAAGEVSIALGIKGPNVTRHEGLAAGLGALGYGLDLLQTRKADAVLAGGGDAGGPALTTALADMGLLKEPRTRAARIATKTPGLYPSEGAVVAVLERAAGRAAQRRPFSRDDPRLRVRLRADAHARGAERRGLVGYRSPCARSTDTIRSTSGRLRSAHGTRIDATELSRARRDAR